MDDWKWQLWCLGHGYRLSWSDFDGRTLRDECKGIINGSTDGEERLRFTLEDCFGYRDAKLEKEINKYREAFEGFINASKVNQHHTQCGDLGCLLCKSEQSK